jgi:predicted HTH domain antitoxin
MEVFGVKRVGGYSLRAFIAKMISVQTAARVHRVPLDEFLDILKKAVEKK